MCRLVSAEGQALVETQSTALFGDVQQLTRQMQEAVGTDVSSLEEVMQRVQQAVEQEKVRQPSAAPSGRHRQWNALKKGYIRQPHSGR